MLILKSPLAPFREKERGIFSEASKRQAHGSI
jgi:hypothetical protein